MSICDKITASEKTSLIMTLNEESDFTRFLMEESRKKGNLPKMYRLEEELERQDSYIRAVEDDCA